MLATATEEVKHTGAAAGRRPGRMLARERAAVILLALSGAVFLPGALNRFVFGKLVLVAIALALAATVPPRGRLPRSALAGLVLAGLLLLGAALAAAEPATALLGRPPRYEGVLVLPLYLGALLAGASLLGHDRARGSTAVLLRWIAVAALAVGIEAVLEAAALRPLSSNVSRPGSLLGNASDEGAWALLAMGPLAAVALRLRQPLHIAGAIAAAATLVCSGSRGALAGAVVLAAVLIATTSVRGERVALLAALALIAIGVLTLPATRERVLERSQRAQTTATGRLLIWGETGQLLRARPLLGVGPSGFLDALPRYHSARYEREVGPQSPPDSPHDWVLQAAIAGGPVLALLALALAALTLTRGYLAIRVQPTGGEAAAVTGILAALAGYAVALLFHFTSPGTTPLAALFAGSLLAGLPSAPARTGPWLRASAAALSMALAIVLAAAAVAEEPLRAGIDAAASGRLAASNSDFDTARALRPWDGGVAATAAHAYATLAADGIGVVVPTGLRWARRELDAYPRSVAALEDAATLELAAGERGAARGLIARALRLDPRNPQLRRF